MLWRSATVEIALEIASPRPLFFGPGAQLVALTEPTCVTGPPAVRRASVNDLGHDFEVGPVRPLSTSTFTESTPELVAAPPGRRDRSARCAFSTG